MDDENMSQIRFPDVTRKLIMNKYIDERIKAIPDPQRWIDSGGHQKEAKSFVKGLERIAAMSDLDNDGQKRRKEKIEAVANALETLIEYAEAADDSSLGYAVWRGLECAYALSECSAQDREKVSRLKGEPIQYMVYDLTHKYKPMLNAFRLGVRLSIKDLPSLDKNRKKEDVIAQWIVNFLERRGITATTSDTGLAGMAFLVTMRLWKDKVESDAKNKSQKPNEGRRDKNKSKKTNEDRRAAHWLNKAKGDGSWKKYIEDARAAIQKDGAE